MTEFYRPPHSSAPGPDYTLWGARPNPFHPGCYCLRVAAKRGQVVRCINTYFYTDGTGPDLPTRVALVVEEWEL